MENDMHISKDELDSIEQARKELWKIFENHFTSADINVIIEFQKVSSVLWFIANRKRD